MAVLQLDLEHGAHSACLGELGRQPVFAKGVEDVGALPCAQAIVSL
ncbi:hypothetical protein [uncultured Friedmanniella sp.]